MKDMMGVIPNRVKQSSSNSSLNSSRLLSELGRNPERCAFRTTD